MTPRPREALQKCLEVSHELSQSSPQNIQALRQVGISYQNLGAFNLGLANLPAARDADQKCVETFLKVAQKDLRNVQAQRELGWSYKKLADAHLQMGNVPAARDAYQAFFEIAQKATQADPKKPEAQGDVAAAHKVLGDIHLRLADVSSAREEYQKALAIFQSLDRPETRYALDQGDLARCYGGLAHLEESVEDFPAAVRWLELEIAILQQPSKEQSPERRASLQNQQQLLEICKLAPRAIESLEFALAQSKETVPVLLGMRCRALSHRGNAQEAAATADKLNSLELADGRDRFHAAVGFALCADGAQAENRRGLSPFSESAKEKGPLPLTEDGPRIGFKPEATPSIDAKTREDHYAARAVASLEQARDLGYFKDPINRDLLRNNADFDVLRGRDDFNKLLRAIYAE